MGRALIISVWRLWEAVFRLFAGVKPMVKGEPHLFMVAKRRYMGGSFSVDGVVVRSGDPVIELHINNEMVLDVLRAEQKSLIGSSVKLLREAQRSLPVLAQTVAQPQFEREQVLYGVTFIHRGVGRLGFEALDLKGGAMVRATSWYLRHLFRIVNPQARAMLARHPDAFVPKLVVISKQRLLSLYLDTESAESAPNVSDHLLV